MLTVQSACRPTSRFCVRAAQLIQLSTRSISLNALIPPGSESRSEGRQWPALPPQPSALPKDQQPDRPPTSTPPRPTPNNIISSSVRPATPPEAPPPVRQLLHNNGEGIKVTLGKTRDDELIFIVRVHAPPMGKLAPLRRVPARWVRDSDVSPRSIDPHTRQKVHSSAQMDFARPLRLRTDGREQVKLLRKGEDGADEKSLKFFWQPSAGEDEYSSIIPLSRFLPIPSQDPLVRIPVRPWTRDRFLSKNGPNQTDPSLSYDDFKSSPKGLYRVLQRLRQDGLVFLRDVPTELKGDLECELRRVAGRIGGLRNTFYGQTWDVKALGSQGRNVAYTNVDLGLHMDLLYFENPPQIQLLHCLRNQVVSGGESYFVDSLLAAKRLFKSDPQAFQLLATEPIPYHYQNDSHHYFHSHPVIQLVSPSPTLPEDGTMPPIKHINWSPPFQSALPARLALATLEAMALFDKHLHAPDLRLTRLMQEGDLVIFNNRRVLHARTAFVEGPADGPGKVEQPSRWLKGGYVDGDAAWDILRVMKDQRMHK